MPDTTATGSSRGPIVVSRHGKPALDRTAGPRLDWRQYKDWWARYEESPLAEGQVAPPDLSAAPTGPSVRDRLSGEERWLIGLANDEIGYFIPPYDFVVADVGPYIFEADGDHYEETYSLGPDTVPTWEEQVMRLVDWSESP